MNVTEKMIEDFMKSASIASGDAGDCVRAGLEAALSTDAEPVACEYGHDNGDGTYTPTYGRWPLPSHIKAHRDWPVKFFYAAPPAPSVAVKELQWDEDGDNLKARMGDREWMLNITADGKTWAGSTRPFVFGRNLTWGSVPNCSMVSLEAAKAACQADCQSRYAALSAPVQDVAGWKLVPKDDESRCIADSALPHEMIEAGIRVQEQVNDDNANYVAGETTDWDCGMVAVAIYRAMLAAAPAAKQEPKT